MTRIFAALMLAGLALSTPGAALAQGPQLSLEQRMLLRCSAAFAMVATRQANDDAKALAYPVLNERGREFFVRSTVRVMDEAQLDRVAISAALTQEAEDIARHDTLYDVIQVCLTMLPPEQMTARTDDRSNG